MRRSWLVAGLAFVLVAAIPGCDYTSDKFELKVSAAASLQRVLDRYGDRFAPARVRLSVAGSDELAAQIRQGVRPDLFAAASTALPDALYADGLVAAPTVFASNRLVLAVPAGGRVRSFADLSHRTVSIAIGSPSVPIGAYTRKLIEGLAPVQRRAILSRVRSNEPNVAGVVGKLIQGAVDAGFVYATDVAAARTSLRAIELPARLRPRIVYAAAVVTGTRHMREARAFIAGLRSGEGRRLLSKAGFGPPPA